jgi:serine/threonine protein kinase
MIINQQNKIEIIGILDKGTFAEVFLARKTNTNELIALKKINERNLPPDAKKYLENEINILKNINHPNIIKLYDDFKENDFIYLALEYCNGGSLSQNLYQYKIKYGVPFPEKVVRLFMKKILLGIKYLHKNRIIHRDLKLDNILLKYDNENDKKNNNYFASELKIIDFNVSYIYNNNLNNLPQTFVGTIPNMSPSIVNNYKSPFKKIYDEKIDIWSLGTLCYEMLFGKPLFNNITREQIFQNILLSNFTIPNTISNLARSFLYTMLQKDGDHRLNASQLLNHEFIKGNNNIKLIPKPHLNINKPINALIHVNRFNQINKRRPSMPNKEIRKITPQKSPNPNFKKRCNGCGINIIKYYKCQICFDVNYCENCYNRYKPYHTHPFIIKQLILPQKNFIFNTPKSPIIQNKFKQVMALNNNGPVNLFPMQNQNIRRLFTI